MRFHIAQVRGAAGFLAAYHRQGASARDIGCQMTWHHRFIPAECFAGIPAGIWWGEVARIAAERTLTDTIADEVADAIADYHSMSDLDAIISDAVSDTLAALGVLASATRTPAGYRLDIGGYGLDITADLTGDVVTITPEVAA